MGVIIVCILISIIIGGISYVGTTDSATKEVKQQMALWGTVISAFCLLCLVGISVGVSYGGNVKLRMELATIEQYQETVNLYAEKGVAEFQPGSGKISELTDLKYNHYQEQIAQMIVSLRNKVTDYNESLVGKQVMDKNWFYGWIVLCPDDLKTIKMSDYPLN